MLIFWSRLAAIAMVLLPVGGITYHAQADVSAQSATASAGGWFILSVMAEPCAVGVIFLGSLWLLVRCVGRSRQTQQ